MLSSSSVRRRELMKEGGKHLSDTTARNCGFSCFMGSSQNIKASQSASFWPKCRWRIKHDGKSMTEYAVKVSPGAEGIGKSESFVLSLSRGGEVIPVQFMSPVRKKENTRKISVKERTKEGKAGRRSWVRMAVGAFDFSTKKSRNGKVIQDPPHGKDSVIVAVQTSTTSGASADSNQGPMEQPSGVLISDLRYFRPRPSEAGNATPVLNRKTRAIDRAQGHVSAPSSPIRRASASSSHSKLPRADVALLRHTPPRPIKVHRLASTVFDSEVAPQNSPHRKAQGRDAAIGFSVLIIILFCLVISDKSFAIVCTSLWWYAVPKLRSIGKSEEPLKTPEAKKLLARSLSNNNMDLQSSEYRKKVIMEGLLQRNHKQT